MKHFIICIFMFYPVSEFLAQDKHGFSVEFNVNQTNYNMKSLNQYLSDTTFYFEPLFYGKNQTNTINKGPDYNLMISYQPFQFMDFGIFTNYQSSSILRSLNFVYTPDPVYYPDSFYVYAGINKIQVNAFTAGLSTYLYINKLLHLDQSKSKILKNLQLSAGFMGGIGFSTLTDRAWIYPPSPHERKNLQYKATNFHGRVEMNIGYRIGKGLFSDVGLKMGYQFFKTSPLKNYNGSYFYPDNDGVRTVHLDFSGLYYGIYLKIGK